MHLRGLLVLLLAVTLTLGQISFPPGDYAQNAASELIALGLPSPLGYPVYLYSMNVTVDAGGAASGYVVLQEDQNVAAYDTIKFSGQFSCDRQSGGLLFSPLQCIDDGAYCESGWFADATGGYATSYGFATDPATNLTSVQLGQWLTASSAIPLQCRNASACGQLSQCGAAYSNPTVANLVVTGDAAVGGALTVSGTLAGGNFLTDAKGNIRVSADAGLGWGSGASYNIAVGSFTQSGPTNATGMIAIGRLAGRLQNHDYAVSIGAYAAFSDVRSPDQTAIGYTALFSANDTFLSTAVGNRAGFAFKGNATTIDIFGASSAMSLTCGMDNAFYGMQSALYLGQYGACSDYNAFFGTFVGQNLVSGGSNTAMGRAAMYGATNASAQDNAAFGTNSMYNIGSGSYNTQVGAKAGLGIIDANYATCVGYSSCYNYPTTQDNTVAIGSFAGPSSDFAPSSVMVGDYSQAGWLSVAVGFRALVGDKAVGIGGNAQAGYEYCIALGYNAACQAFNELTIGSPNAGEGVTTQTTVGAAGGASAPPATPSAYLVIRVNGVKYVTPLYAAA